MLATLVIGLRLPSSVSHLCRCVVRVSGSSIGFGTVGWFTVTSGGCLEVRSMEDDDENESFAFVYARAMKVLGWDWFGVSWRCDHRRRETETVVLFKEDEGRWFCLDGSVHRWLVVGSVFKGEVEGGYNS
ncbi:hypothetical protein RJT34_11508 [Clitoria ternatea]|uniref:Uncharacterized protein n=1 Tax=Clitoria ternatea TaxID=43366 RepID=A0AAN9JK20_CLITE